MSCYALWTPHVHVVLGMRAHWRKRHLASVRLHSCPLCPDEHPKRCSIVRQLQTKHFVPMHQLAIFVQQITSYKANNRKFIDPGPHLCPGNPKRAAYAANQEPATYASGSSSSAPATVSVPPPSPSSAPVSETVSMSPPDVPVLSASACATVSVPPPSPVSVSDSETVSVPLSDVPASSSEIVTVSSSVSETAPSSPWSMPTYKFGPWGIDTDWYYDALRRYEITDASEVWAQWD